MQLHKPIETDLIQLCSAALLEHDPPIDKRAYAFANRDCRIPILYSGNPTSNIAILGRDLGKQEVIHGEPLIGPSGKRVRDTVNQFRPTAHGTGIDAFLCNTVPYKPIDNRPFSHEFRERMRPVLEQLLSKLWTGTHIITLGDDAWDWFTIYHNFGTGTTQTRITRSFPIILCHGTQTKQVTVYPLPHPSPLNARYWKAFPELLRSRLEEIDSTSRLERSG